MKKIFATLFIVLLTLALVGCNKEPTEGAPTLSPEEAVSIYMENLEAWEFKEDYFPMNGYAYCLIDLDFDGVLELITSVCDGSGRYSYNEYYKINTQTRKLEKLSDADESLNGTDYYLMSNESMLLKKSDGSLFYLFADFVRVGGDEGALSYFEVKAENGKVYHDSPFSHHWYVDYTTLASVTEYTFEKESVSESEYHEKTEAYYKENQNMHLIWKYVFGKDFEVASVDEKRQLLLDAYLTFSYDGFSFK